MVDLFIYLTDKVDEPEKTTGPDTDLISMIKNFRN